LVKVILSIWPERWVGMVDPKVNLLQMSLNWKSENL